jgi:hypothetical protein
MAEPRWLYSKMCSIMSDPLTVMKTPDEIVVIIEHDTGHNLTDLKMIIEMYMRMKLKRGRGRPYYFVGYFKQVLYNIDIA